MSKTKERICMAALDLFNEYGVVNVRLQQIADAADMSVGNLAYHFPNKEALVLRVYQNLALLQREVLAEYRLVPLFETMDRVITDTFHLQQAYRFFYLDTLEMIRSFPDIAAPHRALAGWQKSQILVLLAFNESRGAFRPSLEPEKGLLADLIRMVTDLWMSEQLILGENPSDRIAFRRSIWNLYRPLLSRLGKMELDQLPEGNPFH